MAISIEEKMRSCASLLDSADQVVIVGHVHADGDVIGTMSALSHRLKSQGKGVTPFLFEPIPSRFDFLGFQEMVRIFESASDEHQSVILAADAIVILDSSTIERVPGWESLVARKRDVCVRIDHHPSSTPIDVGLDITDEGASATSQLVYRLLDSYEQSLSCEEALGLFVALATDTGWFRYSNTTPAALQQAAELLKSGISLGVIYRNIYQSNELGLIRLMGSVISQMRVELNGRLLWGTITFDQVREAELERDFEIDVLLDLLRSTRDVRCVAVFRMLEDGVIRVNLRSKGEIAVNGVAERFGGGGHRNAAGVTIIGGDVQRSSDEIINSLREVVAGSEAGDD